MNIKDFNSNYGKWEIHMYQKDEKEAPVIEGQLVIDSSKYMIKDPETNEVLLVVPAGNVSYAINLNRF
jgi:hypothetical protein